MRTDLSARDLLARIAAEVERVSAMEHTLARRKVILRDAATRLRTGAGVRGVLALIDEADDNVFAG